MATIDAKAAEAELIVFAAAMPEAWEDHPWDHTVLKVGKKVFVFFGGAASPPGQLSVTVKLPVSYEMALTLPYVRPAGHGLWKGGWAQLTQSDGDQIDLETIKGWIAQSYQAVAPKKLSRRLEAAAPPAIPREDHRVGAMPAFELEQTYLALDCAGKVTLLEGGEAFWRNIATKPMPEAAGTLVTVHDAEGGWTQWEMHPKGDEVLVVLCGQARMVFEHQDGRIERHDLAAGGMLVVPSGVWHRAIDQRGLKMLFITYGAGTTHRPVTPEDLARG